MVDCLFKSFTPEDREIVLDAFAVTPSQLTADGTPSFERADARVRFIKIAVALDKHLILAEREARHVRASA